MLALSRREFLAASAVAPTVVTAQSADEPVAFFVVGDTHYLADRDDVKKLDARSAPVTTRLVDTLNRLPGTAIPAAAGGGTVRTPRGLLHAGDLIDTGDKTNVAMQETEWNAFAADFGLTGSDGRLKVPVYEVHGNHDSPRGDGLVVKQIAARNRRRPGVGNVSPNGVHYSWDWGRVHCIALGIVVGQVPSVTRRRRYAPLDSLGFLAADLREKVGTSGRPVVILHHVDMLRYAGPTDVPDAAATAREWDPADVKGYYDVLKGYNVVAIFYGHTHARNVYKWDGSNRAAAAGIPTFNVDNSSHFGSPAQAFFYVEVGADRTTVREYATPDNYQTGSWTPQTWTTPVGAK
ncbi:MAG: metallophosphoesterase [Gemmataceae bacterium]